MFAVCDSQPVTGSQTSAVQAFVSLQFSAIPPPQTPLEQVSFNVHALPVLHAVPSALGTFEQAPVPGLQTPAS
jgi:hypothetical protein